MDKTEELIFKFALQNAVKYAGKANPGSVVPKVIGADPLLKEDMKTLVVKINEVVSRVNKISVEEQVAKLKEIAPELLEKKKEERNIFGFYDIKAGEKIRTAFPPGPEKYPHLGHAKALILNYLLAKQYDGEFFLRFEDTNPKLVKKEFYDIMQENFRWLGVEWTKLQYASDNMELFKALAEKLIKGGNAYMCFCETDAARQNRAKGIECGCRGKSIEESLADWKRFPTLKEGEASLRLKIDLNHQNTTMRDPTIFRIIDVPHARHGTKYRVWPNYDFQNSVMDGYFGITHRIRSKEFEMRAELQRHIQKTLGLTVTNTYEMARFNMEGVESSGRIIREKVANKELIGWDDPSLTTIVALRRRGFLPEAIRDFVISTGISKSESTLTWDDLIIHNRRILDSLAKRFFMLIEPVEIRIEGAPAGEHELNLNPNEKKGGRKFQTDERFLLQRRDIEKFRSGELIRFMDCLNFRDENGKYVYDSTDYMQFRDRGSLIVHWLPAKETIDVEVLMPDKSLVSGVAEQTLKILKIGEIIQFERFGFCRLDSIEGRVYKFWYAHK
jgi:glutamyl-tRNA synthetase